MVGEVRSGSLIRVAVLALIAACLLAHPRSAAAQVPTPNVNQFGLTMIGAPAAWALGYSGLGATVAVADTGIDLTHPAFAGKIDLRSLNFQLPSAGAPYVATQVGELDNGGHGTHVAGIIAAAGSSNAPGVAYAASVVVLRIINGVTVPQIGDSSVAALNYFAGLTNVMVYNASYGPDYSTPPNQNRTIWPASGIGVNEAVALRGALANGKIVVAATGNDRANNPVAGVNPSGLALYPFIQTGVNANVGVYNDGGNNFNFSTLLTQPGLLIAVTAVGQSKTIASYAQFCGVTASWCVAAPGGDQPNDGGIFSTLPVSTYGALSGTSMAAPMVSGALAVLQQAYTGYNARDIANVLFATAENVGGQAADNAVYGYGMIRLDRALLGLTTLAAGTSLNLGAGQVAYFSQPLTTGGSFAFNGPGYLIIAGRTLATGDAFLNGGALGVDGTLTLQTQLTVAPGAMLSGFGTIVGNVAINGILNAGQLPNYTDLANNNGGTIPAGIPLTGTSPGTLTFQGNVALGANAITRANIDGPLQIPGGPSTYDKIFITGTGSVFAVNGGLVPVLRGIPGGTNSYVPPVGALFPFIMAQNGAVLTGGFTSLAQPFGLANNTRMDVVYQPSTISLSVTPLNFQNFVVAQNLNQNQQAIGNILDGARPAPGTRAISSQAQTIFNDLYEEDSSENEDIALTSLSGQGHAATPGAVMAGFSGFSDVLADHQAAGLTGGAITQAAFTPSVAFAYAGRGPSAEARVAGIPFPRAQAASSAQSPWTTWGQAYGRWSTVGAANGLPGYSSTSGGFVLGMDRMISTELTTGAAFGYTRATTNGADMKGSTDTYTGAVYASWTPGSFVFDGRLAAGPTFTGTSRTIVFPGISTPTATGSVNGWGALVAAEAGYRFNLSGVMLKPYVGVTSQFLNQSAFTETTDFGLSFPAQKFTKLTTSVGTLASKTFQSGVVTLMPQVKLAWLRDLRNDSLSTQAALLDVPFIISGADPGRDAAVAGLQLAAWQTESLRVFGGYTGEFRKNATSHQLAGGVRAIW